MSARLRWVRQQVEEGAVVYFTFGSAAAQGRGKVKIMIQHTATCTSPIARSLLRDALASVEKRAAVSSVVDRGHKHSNGCSEVALWFSDTATKVDGGSSSFCTGAPAPVLLPTVATGFAPPVGDMNAPSGLPLLHVSPPDVSGFADETAEPLVTEGSTRPMDFKSCLKPPSLSCSEDVPVHVLHNMMLAAKDTLKNIMADYERMKALPLSHPNRSARNLAIADKAFKDAYHVANKATERWHAAFQSAGGADAHLHEDGS